MAGHEFLLHLARNSIFFFENPLLRKPLKLEHMEQLLLGHWGTTPGQNFIYAHLNRVIKQYDLDMIYVSGPGHGGPALVANAYLEGTYSEVYPNISRDEDGLKKLFAQFSFPGGISSHVSPQTPGSIHEGGELGYSISHAFGAVFDNPELVVACVVGDGEAETGPLATAWHSNKFLDPVTDGVVLPILHLNGFKSPTRPSWPASPTRNWSTCSSATAGRLSSSRDTSRRRCTRRWPQPSIRWWSKSRQIQHAARTQGNTTRPRWPMIVLRSPKGWTGPKYIDGLPVEGTFRAHQVPLSVSSATPPEHLEQLESWMRSYKPEELFDERGRLMPELAELAPKGERRMGANPHANGGKLLRACAMPDFRTYAVMCPRPPPSWPAICMYSAGSFAT